MPDQSQNTTQKGQDGPAAPEINEAVVLQRIIAELTPLSCGCRRRIIDTVCTFFGLSRAETDGGSPVSTAARPVSESARPFLFSETEPRTPKEFMHEKGPTTDVERVACLAYYLTHYRSTPHFKTKDISDLNTEAAQRRFSNAAFAVVNATNAGYLVPSVKGCKQLSATAEQFVQALPDREAASDVRERLKPRRGGKHSRKKAALTSKS